MTEFGLNMGPQQVEMPELRMLWRAADKAGYDWLSSWDHFYPDNTPFSGPCYEGLTLHAAMACDTHTARLGSTVYCAAFRHPAVLANALVNIDHLSDGRLELGIGAGWHEAEFNAYGIPFEAPGVRLRRLRESVEIIRALWTQESVDYDGEFYTLHEAYCSPKPLQESPRIWLGTLGEKVGLPMAGELGDAWNCSLQSVESFRRKREIVLDASANPKTFKTSINLPYVSEGSRGLDYELELRFGSRAGLIREAAVTGSMDQIISKVGSYVEAGSDIVIFSVRAPYDSENLAWLLEGLREAFPAKVAGNVLP